MGPVSIGVKYRPLRIGWCIESDSLKDFTTAVRLTHVFWGGKFNPIIPCANREMAEAVISAFRVDALYNVSGTSPVESFIKEFPHLAWSAYESELFLGNGKEMEPTLLDVAHPAREFFDKYVEGKEKASIEGTLYAWSDEDPLRYALLASCGAYPPPGEVGQDYSEMFQKALAAKVTNIGSAENLPDDFYRQLTPNLLTSIRLTPDSGASHWAQPGFYVGDAGGFTDLVNFWNLRACDIDLLFYDPRFAKRLESLTKVYSELLRSRPRPGHWPNAINLWTSHRDLKVDTHPFDLGVSLYTVTPSLWNGLNLNPPVMSSEAKSVLGAPNEDGLGPAVTLQLPEKPFRSVLRAYYQRVVVSVSAPNVGNVVFTPPFIPRLNEYYSRRIYFPPNNARAELRSVGLIVSASHSQLTIRGIPFTELACTLFDAFGMAARPSPAGLVGVRLIDQMGGLQGCRVFKIAGVRHLIKKYPPTTSFERTEAVGLIGNRDPRTGVPRFDEYASLYIEPRDRGPLAPNDAFVYLLKKGVFRTGLKFLCPHCGLDFWIHVDDVKSISQCIYCGKDFNVLPQLKDRNWSYRRSGLFGRSDHQHGGIPVAVTLQQLEIALHGQVLAYTTGVDVQPNIASVEKCETDFVLIVSGMLHREGVVQLVIGECKDSGGEITEEDVRKLTKVALALEKSQCRVFMLFSKCGEFTDAEVERCKEARKVLWEHEGQIHYENNVIIFSRRELEPYRLYERTEKEYEIGRPLVSLDDFGRVTENVFFNPKKKVSS